MSRFLLEMLAYPPLKISEYEFGRMDLRREEETGLKKKSLALSNKLRIT